MKMKKGNSRRNVKASMSPKLEDDDFMDDDLCSTGNKRKLFEKIYYCRYFLYGTYSIQFP
jgi:hypothetical protein